MMSYHDLPEIHDYFSTEPDLRVQPITETMPRDRFYSIRRGLYFANNHDAPDKKGPNTQQSLETSSTDQTFQCCFPKCHGFNFEHEIDQGMTKSKGNHVLKQYMKQNQYNEVSSIGVAIIQKQDVSVNSTFMLERRQQR